MTLTRPNFDNYLKTVYKFIFTLIAAFFKVLEEGLQQVWLQLVVRNILCFSFKRTAAFFWRTLASSTSPSSTATTPSASCLVTLARKSCRSRAPVSSWRASRRTRRHWRDSQLHSNVRIKTSWRFSCIKNRVS